MTVSVVASDARDFVDDAPDLDVARWERLARRAAEHEGGVGELTLTFVTTDEIAALNAEFMDQVGPTDVLSFPMDDDEVPGVPTLLGDIVVCPAVAAAQASEHAGTFDDEIALLVVHGVLHVLGHDHADPDDAEVMREREAALLCELHWDGPAPADFSHTHS